jgi:antitoxin VapB
MALNIKDATTEQLATELARLTGETKTSAVRVALEERRQRLARRTVSQDRGARLARLLEDEIWPQVPPEALGAPLTREQREEILGYGPEGV